MIQINEPTFWNQELAAAPPCDMEELRQVLLIDVVNAAPIAECSEEQLFLLGKYVRSLVEQPDLLDLWGRFYYVLYEKKSQDALNHNPGLESCGIPDAGAFYLSLILAGVRFGEHIFRNKKWPLAIYYDGLIDIRVWMDDYKKNFGQFGISWSMAFGWLVHHHTGNVLQFGRLQCNPYAEFYSDVFVFRNTEDRQVIALLDVEQGFNAEGYTVAPGCAAAFTTTRLEEKFGRVTAHPISPTAIVSPSAITLDLNHWERFLMPGDHVINLHIPAIGPLEVPLCNDSTFRMLAFFKKFIPDFQPKAFVCHSWLLDPQLKKLLPEHSNLRAFQRAGYLLPSDAPSDAIRRVFGAGAVQNGVESVPHTTGMQKRLAAFLRNGGSFRSGRFFLHVDDIPWGTNPYL